MANFHKWQYCQILSIKIATLAINFTYDDFGGNDDQKRQAPGVMRFGKRAAPGVMRFGKRAAPGVMRFGKRAAPGVMRFGKRQAPGVMRFGKRAAPGVMRFGKRQVRTASNCMSSHVSLFFYWPLFGMRRRRA